MRAALYIGGVTVHRVTTKRLRELSRALGVDGQDAAYLALDWEGRPLGVVACNERANGGTSCHVTLADHPEREAVLLALVKSVWRRTPANTFLEVTGAPLEASRFSPPFSLRASQLSVHWQAFLALPHRYLGIP